MWGAAGSSGSTPAAFHHLMSMPLNLETTFPPGHRMFSSQKHVKWMREWLCWKTWQSILGESWQSQKRFAHVRDSLSDTRGNGSQRHRNPVGINSTSSIWIASPHCGSLAKKVAPDLLIHVGGAVSRQNGKRCGRGSLSVEIVWIDPDNAFARRIAQVR